MYQTALIWGLVVLFVCEKSLLRSQGQECKVRAGIEQEVWILLFVLVWLGLARSCCCLLLLFLLLCPCPSLQVRVLLVGYVLLQQVVDGDDPAVVELSVERHLLLLHLRLHLHHLQRWVVVVTVLHRVQLLRQVLLQRVKGKCL